MQPSTFIIFGGKFNEYKLVYLVRLIKLNEFPILFAKKNIYFDMFYIFND
jgi:hypothetical protein